MRRKKIHTNGPRDVKQCLLGPFFVRFASSYPIVLFCHCSVPGPCRPRHSFAPFCGFELHPFPPHEQLLAVVVLGAGGCVGRRRGFEAAASLEHT
jgi:hypothetical protein